MISILIPCNNAERWIAQAIESALAQSWLEKEVIVVDDGSTDGSLEIIKTFDGKIRWETGPNRGGNIARNRLLELARGEWLQYLDADDYLLADKVENQLKFLATHSDADVVFGPVTMEYYFENKVRRQLLPVPEPHDAWILLVRWFLPQTGASLWRKQAILDVGGWKLNQPCCQEHELYSRLLMSGKRFAFCSENGAIYRQWGEHTVCKRDKPEVHRQRLEIEQRVEDFLRARNELTPERQQAVNQARFEIARLVWLYDRDFAARIIRIIHRAQPVFVPGGAAAPTSYKAIYKTLGFHAAESLAAWKRRLTGSAA